jgi:uncharacterized protein
MILPDVNVLVYAYMEEVPDHSRFRAWLEELVNSREPFGISDLVLSGFLRVVTHRRVFRTPSPIERAFAFASTLRGYPNCVPITPGARHWEIFGELCRAAQARGNLIPDAFLAALAIESGSEWISTDQDFARFKGLRFRHPLI